MVEVMAVCICITEAMGISLSFLFFVAWKDLVI
jgi:hypothetical protein